MNLYKGEIGEPGLQGPRVLVLKYFKVIEIFKVKF